MSRQTPWDGRGDGPVLCASGLTGPEPEPWPASIIGYVRLVRRQASKGSGRDGEGVGGVVEVVEGYGRARERGAVSEVSAVSEGGVARCGVTRGLVATILWNLSRMGRAAVPDAALESAEKRGLCCDGW